MVASRKEGQAEYTCPKPKAHSHSVYGFSPDLPNFKVRAPVPSRLLPTLC